MMWNVEITRYTRSLIGDIVPPYIYTDSTINQVILTAARIVIQDTNISGYATMLGVSGYISPDPTILCDDDFVYLIALKAACLLDTNQARSMVNIGVGGTTAILGPMSYNFQAQSTAVQDLFDYGLCNSYEEFARRYALGDMSNLLSVVLSPATLVENGGGSGNIDHLACSGISVATPSLNVTDEGSASIEACISNSSTGSLNTVLYTTDGLAWTAFGTSISGDGCDNFSISAGNYYFRADSTLSGVTTTSVPKYVTVTA